MEVMGSTKVQGYADDIQESITGKKRKESKDFFSQIDYYNK